MQEAIREKILRDLDALGEHVKSRPLTVDEVNLYLGLLRESRNFMAPEEVQKLLQARRTFDLGGT